MRVGFLKNWFKIILCDKLFIGEFLEKWLLNPIFQYHKKAHSL